MFNNKDWSVKSRVFDCFGDALLEPRETRFARRRRAVPFVDSVICHGAHLARASGYVSG
jgi:hypothetical protein